MKNLFKALAAFQEEVPTIHEDTKGYNYTYSNLNTIFKTIKPLLKKHGLGFTQPLSGSNIKTIIFHIESGEVLESEVNIPQDVTLKGMNTFQVMGSAITYYRRYSLSAALGLITDKDIDAKGEEETPLKWLNPNTKEWDNAVSKEVSIDEVKKYYKISKENEELYNNIFLCDATVVDIEK
jgi:hypothetical protein